MFDILFRLIPKGTNEIIFLGGTLGLIYYLYNKKKTRNAVLFFSIIVFCITIRLIVKTKLSLSSRYFSILIFPYSFFFALFVVSLFKYKNRIIRIITIICTFISLYLIIMKDIKISPNSQTIYFIADYLNSTKKTNYAYNYLIQPKEYYRISHISGLKEKMKASHIDDKSISKYILNYRTAYSKSVIHISTKDKSIAFSTAIRPVLFLPPYHNRGNTHFIYEISSNDECFPVSTNQPPQPPDNSLLENGDLEILETPEKSFSKLKNNIKDFSMFYNFDDSIQTPINAFFQSTSKLNSLPLFTVSKHNSISGNSVHISYCENEGCIFLFFYQKFDAGEYTYSLQCKGNSGTNIGVLYKVLQDNKWTSVPLTFFTIPDKRLFCLSSTFSVDNLNPSEYFIIGVWVRGDAYLDNFSIIKL